MPKSRNLDPKISKGQDVDVKLAHKIRHDYRCGELNIGVVEILYIARTDTSRTFNHVTNMP